MSDPLAALMGDLYLRTVPHATIREIDAAIAALQARRDAYAAAPAANPRVDEMVVGALNEALTRLHQDRDAALGVARLDA